MKLSDSIEGMKSSSLSLPRERLLRFGASTLSLTDLWSCILGVGRVGDPVQDRAVRVVRWSSEALSTAEVPSAQALASLGPAQQARVLACVEVAKRAQQRQAVRLQSVRDVQLLTQELIHSRREEIWAFYCATDGSLLHRERLALGGLNMAALAPRDIFLPLRFCPADSVLLCHNHPSGDPTPSHQDILFTQRMIAACQLMGVWLRDHVIVAKQGHTSLRQEALLEWPSSS